MHDDAGRSLEHHRATAGRTNPFRASLRPATFDYFPYFPFHTSILSTTSRTAMRGMRPFRFSIEIG